MNLKENEYLKGTWVKISDVQVEMPSNGYSYMSADVHIPCGVTMVDMEEYIKFIQDETIKKFADAFILNGTTHVALSSFFPERDVKDICTRYKGSEIMSKIDTYEKRQQIKKAAEKQKKIQDAKKLLENEGYTVYSVEDKKK